MADESLIGDLPPPGICGECLHANLVFLVEHVAAVHCRHSLTGAVGTFKNGSVDWYAWRPITRTDFETVAAQAVQDAYSRQGNATA
jgi:hypothetical protein